MSLLTRALGRAARLAGYEVRRIQPPPPPPAPPPAVPYAERPEVGAKNLAVKLARAAAGGPFEWPDIVALNKTVATLVGGARRVAELGSGTGAFAVEAAADPAVSLVCSEFDAEACAWAAENRARPNVRYVCRPIDPADGPFDLVVCIEVVEHVTDFRGLLDACAALAPRAIVTTPNKLRHPHSLTGPPAYEQHVREWTAGEFYWVCRVFWERVRLFSMPDPLGVGAKPISVTATDTPLIAVCEEPRPAVGAWAWADSRQQDSPPRGREW